MDDTTMQVVIASVGVVGTLAAALLTQLLTGRAEQRRRVAEDHSRWLADRLRVNTRFLAGSLSLERDLWSAASHLDRDDRVVRMPGLTTIFAAPEEGLPGVFDEITLSILVEAVEEAFTRLDALEELAAEIALVGTEDEVHAARELQDALVEVVGLLEGYQPFDAAADAVERVRAARDAFTRSARAGLRTGGEVGALDARPRWIEDSDSQSA